MRVLARTWRIVVEAVETSDPLSAFKIRTELIIDGTRSDPSWIPAAVIEQQIALHHTAITLMRDHGRRALLEAVVHEWRDN